MTSLQDYIEKFRGIGKSLGITGQTVEVLSHLLANAVFISEMENATYMKESSLEKCSLLNSKIQHCVDNMYSVYRGACPRVIMKFKPLKYMTLSPYQEIITSQKFSIYYLAYWNGKEWCYSNKTYYPNETPEKILCLLAKEKTSISKEINSSNTYYVDCIEDSLSDDCYITIQGSLAKRTRIFAEHILEHSVFDLTLPSYGSRLFFANYYKDAVSRDSQDIVPLTEKSIIEATYFKYSTLDAYNETELGRVKLQGGELIDFNEDELIPLTGGSLNAEQANKGLYYVDALSRDDSGTIHYKANRDRYVNSIIRSNSDIGVVLEETYPNIVKTGGTNYVFNSSAGYSSIDIYYIPNNDQHLLGEKEVKSFSTEKRAYYITADAISVKRGLKYIANFNISIDLFKGSNENWINLIGEVILREGYGRRFNISFNDETIEEIKTLISKLPDVKKITQLDFSIMDENGVPYLGVVDPETSYFDITFSIATTVRV